MGDLQVYAYLCQSHQDVTLISQQFCYTAEQLTLRVLFESCNLFLANINIDKETDARIYMRHPLNALMVYVLDSSATE